MELVAPKEAPPPHSKSATEDVMLSVTASMARDAAVLFQSRRYAECAEMLSQLVLKKEGDPKVLHNMAITGSFLDGCPDPKKLLENLCNVKKRSEELACASREQADSVNGEGNNTSASRGSGIMPPISTAHNETVYGDEFDTTIITFNTAVILYHLHDYESALSFLEPLYRNIEPIDETTALHVCFLLLDITMALQDASKAADIIQYLERSFGVANTMNQNEIATTIPHQPAQIKTPAKSNMLPDSDSITYPVGSENISVGSFSDDTLDFESFYSTLDGGNHLGRPALNDFSRASADLAATAADLKVRLQIYKVRLLLLTRYLKVAKRELKVLMNMARGRDSSTELLLKSQLEYNRGNYRKAVKLSTSNNQTDPVMLAMFYNNLGCILHQQRSNHTSILCFSKALKYSLSLRSEKPLKLSTLSQDKSCLISYNCGIQHLMCGKPLLASRCFREAMPLLYNRPLFWLRFAECGLLALEKGVLSSSGAISSNDEIEVHVMGSGKWKHLVINPVKSRCHSSDSGGVTSDEHGNLISLRFARQCLLNAKLLLDGSEQENMVIASDTGDCNQGSQCQKSQGHKNTMSTESKLPSGPTLTNANGEQKGATSLNATLQSSLALYDDICRKENLKIRQAILGDLAFIELCLENPLKALSIAKLLQQLPDCSRMHLFLSHVYAAEALCALNKPKEAAHQLAVYLRDGNDIELPYIVENCENALVEKDSDGEDSIAYTVTKLTSEESTVTKLTSEESMHSVSLKPEEACGVLYIDLGMTAAMQGDLEQANYMVARGFAMLPNNPRALLASIYLDLLQGKAQEAIAKLRRCRNVRFRNSSIVAASS